jgi:hypothetical protein
MDATGRKSMEKKEWYSANSLLRAGGSGFVLLGAAAILGCGGDDSTGPARIRYPSSITANATGCGTVVVGTGTSATNVQTYNLSTTWQATGTWQAEFVNAGTGKILATTKIDETPTKTSIVLAKDGSVASSCQFKKGDIVYAILSPAGSDPVKSDADLTATLTVGS